MPDRVHNLPASGYWTDDAQESAIEEAALIIQEKIEKRDVVMMCWNTCLRYHHSQSRVGLEPLGMDRIRRWWRESNRNHAQITPREMGIRRSNLEPWPEDTYIFVRGKTLQAILEELDLDLDDDDTEHSDQSETETLRNDGTVPSLTRSSSPSISSDSDA